MLVQGNYAHDFDRAACTNPFAMCLIHLFFSLWLGVGQDEHATCGCGDGGLARCTFSGLALASHKLMSEFVATQWSVDVSKHLNLHSIRSEYSEHQELLPILSDWIG